MKTEVTVACQIATIIFMTSCIRVWQLIKQSENLIPGNRMSISELTPLRRNLLILWLPLLLTCGVKSLSAEEKPTATSKPIKKLILPGEAFLIQKRPAFILLPPKEKRYNPQPWIMYAPTLPCCPDIHEKWMHQQFLAAGIAVAGIDAGEAYGSPDGQKLMSSLYEELTKNRGFAKKTCLLGRSRGGLWVSSWAIRNTEKITGLAGIYPVYDLTTYPGVNRASGAYKLTPEELTKGLKEHNPIEKISALAKAKVPVCIIHGDIDHVVPLKENSQSLKEVYQKEGKANLVKLIVVKGQGHNYWKGFFHCQELVDFAIQQAKAGMAQPAAKKGSKP